MWEYSINFNTDNINAANFCLQTLKECSKDYGSVATLITGKKYHTVLIACEDYDRARMEYCVKDTLITIYLAFFKEAFLTKYLNVNIASTINNTALKKALVNFDKETDVHILSRTLDLHDSIYLESFFDFKLSNLKNKWFELTRLANENSGYLSCNDTCNELIKFLIDSLEVCYDVANVVESHGKYKVCDVKFNEIGQSKTDFLSDENLISCLIEICPKTINIYTDTKEENDIMRFLSSIFENRVNFLPSDLIMQKNS